MYNYVRCETCKYYKYDGGAPEDAWYDPTLFRCCYDPGPLPFWAHYGEREESGSFVKPNNGRNCPTWILK